MPKTKCFRFYNAGRLPGDEQDLYMFTCYGPASDQPRSLGCHSVYARDLQANIKALREMGYVDA